MEHQNNVPQEVIPDEERAVRVDTLMEALSDGDPVTGFLLGALQSQIEGDPALVESNLICAQAVRQVFDTDLYHISHRDRVCVGEPVITEDGTSATVEIEYEGEIFVLTVNLV